MKKKIGLIIAFIVCLVFIIFISIYFINKNKDNNKLGVKKTVHEITFSDVKIKKDNNEYIFYVTLTSKTDVLAESFDVDIKDKNGKSITILSGYIGNIASDETKIIEMRTTKRIDKAYEVSYTVYND